MDTRANQDTERERNRARIAADLAEFLLRGGVIEHVATEASMEATRQNARHYSPVRSGGAVEDRRHAMVPVWS